MRQLISIVTIFILTSCGDSKMVDNSQIFTNTKTDIKFPVSAKQKNPEVFEDDTLIAVVDNIHFTITPTGKLYWGQNPADTFQLLTDMIVEKAYLFKTGDTLLCFYTETDHDGATSRLEKINLMTRQQILKSEIQGFNLELPFIRSNFAYVTTIGVVGKLNLHNGKYAYQYFDLYDNQNIPSIVLTQLSLRTA
ncbi:MAG: hypothetical protein IPF62_12260 [Bacteroidetes bacterium]|nr:hypothetical protein [Bacteroidota bacterium]